MNIFKKSQNQRSKKFRRHFAEKNIIIFLFFCYFSFLECNSFIRYPPSDHFDGNRFFNPTQTEENGFWETLKLLITIRFEKWPEEVKNDPAIDMSLILNKDQIAITFINHATVLIQAFGINILTDPVWANQVGPFAWMAPKRVREPGIKIEELPPIHLVLVSHNHYDHLDLDTLKVLNQKFASRFLVPLGDKKLLESAGILDTVEMDWWQKISVRNGVEVVFVPTQHISGRGIFDWNQSLWGSYLIRIGKKKVYFGGDAAYSSHYQEIKTRLESPDISLLPIGAYEPRWFMKLVHMNPSEAVKAHMDLGSKQSIGIHFGTFQQTEESINAPVKELKEALLQAQIGPDFFTLQKEGRTKIYSVGTEERFR